MNRQTLIIDNTGFDVEAMAQMPEQEFITLFLGNDAIARHKTEDERKAYLKNCYAAIQKAAAPPVITKPKRPSAGK